MPAGSLLGSFLNVVTYRLPRGESLSRPRSRCPGCGTQIGPHDNIPVALAGSLLRGRCRDCGTPISARYPLVEALTAALCVAVVLAFGADERRLARPGLRAAAGPVAFIDLDHRIIPNKLTGLGAVVARRPRR